MIRRPLTSPFFPNTTLFRYMIAQFGETADHRPVLRIKPVAVQFGKITESEPDVIEGKRPFTLDYVRLAFSDFSELHGDRLYSEDRKSTRLNSSHANISAADL